jgi:hypothetical protein
MPARPWNTARWAKAVGSTYIEKSMKSWRRRLGTGRGSIGTAILFAIWNTLPSTVALRLGSVFPDARTARRSAEFEKAVRFGIDPA